MIFAVVTTFVMLAAIDRSVRRGGIELATLEARYNMFALRDHLRRKLIDGDVPPNRWFNYLDTTISKTIKYLGALNIWSFAAVLVSYRRSHPIWKEAAERRREAFERPENAELARFYEEFHLEVARYMVRRHDLIFDVWRAAKTFDGARKKIRTWPDKIAEIFVSAPETSTLMDVCPAGAAPPPAAEHGERKRAIR